MFSLLLKKVMKTLTIKFSLTICLIVVNGLVQGQIVSRLITGCLPSVAYSFQLSTSPSNPVSICWDLNDGNGFTCNNSSRAQGIYSTPGQRNITCRVETSPGVFQQYSTVVDIHPLPNPLFSIDNPNGLICGNSANRVFSLFDTSNVVSVVWEIYSKTGQKISGTQSFNSSGFTLQHTFITSDTFRVKAIVFNRFNCVKDTSLYFPIKLVPTVSGTFSTISDLTTCLPANFTFNSQLQIPTGVVVQSATWTLTNIGVTPNTSTTFVRNTQASDSITLPTFTNPGRYEISLLVSYQGCSSTISTPILIEVDHAPILNFSVNGSKNPVQICLGQVFELNNQSITPTNTIGGWFEWDFYGLTKSSGAIRSNYKPRRVFNSPTLSKYRYQNISILDSGVNSVILKWNGACSATDTLKNVILTKGPLARIRLTSPNLQYSCDSPFVFQLNDSSSWKPSGFSYTQRWFRFNTITNTLDSAEGTPKTTYFDTIHHLGEKRFYQLKIISSDGCTDTSIQFMMERKMPKADFAPFPWYLHQTMDTLSCDTNILFPYQSNNPYLVNKPGSKVYRSIVPNPFDENLIYEVRFISPIYSNNNPNANATCLSTGKFPWSQLRQPTCVWIGPNIIRQIVGIDTGFTKCTDTLEKVFFVKNFDIAWGKKVNGNIIPNPTAICLGANGAPVSQVIHIHEDSTYRWPADNIPLEFIWTVYEPLGSSQNFRTSTPMLNITFPRVGVYRVFVEAKTYNCTEALTMEIKVGEIASIAPLPNLADTLVLCSNTDITSIVGSGSIGTQFSYRWEIYQATSTGLGPQINPLQAGSPVRMDSMNIANPKFYFTNNRPYYLVLFVTNEYGCTDSTRLIVLGSSITALIRPDTMMACPGYQLFRSLNTDATQFRWDFTDPIGNLGSPLLNTLINPYPMDSVLGYFGIGGMKTVKLTVVSQYGCIDDTTMFVRVGGPIPRVSVVSPTSKKGCDSLQVILQDQSQFIDQYLFSWGDGSDGYYLGQTNTHVYKYPYSVKNDSALSFVFQLLAVGQSCIVPYRDTITLFPRPVVGGSILSDSLCSPAAFTIIDTSRFAPNGRYGSGSSNTVFSLNFNDGTGWITQTAPVSNRTFRKSIAHPGAYSTSMAITNPWGCVDTGNIGVLYVLDTPIANFYALDSIKCWQNGSNGFDFIDASAYPNSSPKSRIWYWQDSTAVPNGLNGYLTNGPTTGPVHFTVPGSNVNVSHTISLKVINQFGCSDSITKPQYITVLDTLPPSPISPTFVTVDPLSLRNHVEVNWNASTIPNFGNYEIFRNNVQIATINNSTTTTFQDQIDVITAAASQQYTMRMTDHCGQRSPFDTTHATIHLTTSMIANNGFATNTLRFNAYQGWGLQSQIQAYEVYRKTGNLGQFSLVGKVTPQNGNSFYAYSDSGLCSNTYFYYVKAIHIHDSIFSSGYYSFSNYDSITTYFNPMVSPLEINFVTVDAENKISIQWTPSPLASGVLKNYILERIDPAISTPVMIYRGTSTSFSDVNVDASSKIYKYVVRYEDQCGNLSNPSDTSVNILASSSAVQIGNYNAYDMKVDWTPYATWKNGVIRYDVEVKYPNGWKTIGSVPSSQYTFTDVNVPRNEIEGAYSYRIKAIENSGSYDSSYSNITNVHYPSQVFVPTAFSPNNDGVNDVHFVHYVAIKSAEFLIFNRWGECIFKANDVQTGWNGKLNNTGEPCQNGMYIYTLNAKGKDNRNYQQKGIITLLK